MFWGFFITSWEWLYLKNGMLTGHLGADGCHLHKPSDFVVHSDRRTRLCTSTLLHYQYLYIYNIQIKQAFPLQI